MKPLRSRRKRWMIAFAAGFLLVCLDLVLFPGGVDVVVYNDSTRDFQNVTVSVGKTSREVGLLRTRESILLHFPASGAPADVRLFMDSDPPLRWTAPSLAGPSISRITLRADDFGGVTTTLEKQWLKKLLDFLS